MTQSKGSFTPGPWFAVWNGLFWDINVDNGRYAQSVAFSHANHVLKMPAEEAEANARLIAAAPALLEAGQRIADDYQTSDTHHPEHVLIRKSDFDALRAAIQSATGEG